MKIRAKIIICILLFIGISISKAQEIETISNSKGMDSVRNKFDNKSDSIAPTAKFIRYTTLAMLQDSVQTLPLDTSLKNFQYPSLLFQPFQPTIGIGNLGIEAKSMLFQPYNDIGFDIGMHSLDLYRYTHDDVIYYRARSPFTSIYYSNATVKEQILKVILSQNITKNWNFGANFNRIGAQGFYERQRGDVMNASVQSWYHSQNKRYNLMSSLVFNTLKTYENGGLVNNNPFVRMVINKPTALPVKLTNAGNIWRDNGIMIKQSYFIGRIDSAIRDSVMTIFPTNKITHTFSYSNRSFKFYNLLGDNLSVLPRGLLDTTKTNDTTNYKQLHNEFTYTFFVRGKNTSAIKNEIKINAGLVHDLYIFKSYSIDSTKNQSFLYNSTFQNVGLKGDASYRFSNKLNLNFYAYQLVQGRQSGDFQYQGSAYLDLGRIAGKITMQASIQNKSPQWIYNYTQTNHYQWKNNFDRTKTTKASFSYDNNLLKFTGAINYFLIGNHLYLEGLDSTGVTPKQFGPIINLLQISAMKTFEYKKFRFQTYWVYQKSNQASIIRTPKLYTFNSFSYLQTAFKILKFELGLDAIFNTSYKNYAYSPALGQFYNSDRQRDLPSYPIFNIWIKANLKRANFFARYDYLNQGVFSPGYYTVERYPMGNRILKLGFIWNFYD